MVPHKFLRINQYFPPEYGALTSFTTYNKCQTTADMHVYLQRIIMHSIQASISSIFGNIHNPTTYNPTAYNPMQNITQFIVQQVLNLKSRFLVSKQHTTVYLIIGTMVKHEKISTPLSAQETLDSHVKIFISPCSNCYYGNSHCQHITSSHNSLNSPFLQQEPCK
jgi:hypothetical protein